MAKQTLRKRAQENKRAGDELRPEGFGGPSTKVFAPRNIHLSAKTENQKHALALLSRGTSVVILRGAAGTGKSMLAVYRASKLLAEKSIKKVYLLRPAVTVGSSVGLLPGELDEKLAPYFQQTRKHFETFLGVGFANACLEDGKIEMGAVEYQRGQSYENCVVIIEESQNFTIEELEMLLTRVGDGCQLIFTGDEKQNDLKKGGVGLTRVVNMVQKALEDEPDSLRNEDLDVFNDEFGVVTFTVDDVVRSGVCAAFVRLFHSS